MKKQTLVGLTLAGITGIGSAIAAITVNRMNRKQLNKVEVKEEIKEEVKEEVREENNNINEENNDSEHKDEQLNIDDSDIDV